MIGVMRGSTWKQEGSQSQSVQYRASSWNWWSVVDSLRVSKHFGSGSTLDASQVNTLLLSVKRKARKDASKRSCGTSKYLSGDCTQQVIDRKILNHFYSEVHISNYEQSNKLALQGRGDDRHELLDCERADRRIPHCLRLRPLLKARRAQVPFSDHLSLHWLRGSFYTVERDVLVSGCVMCIIAGIVNGHLQKKYSLEMDFH